MSDRKSGFDTNISSILGNAPDVDALEEGEVVEVELFPAELPDGTMSVAIEVSRGLTNVQKTAILDRAEEMVDKQKLKSGQTIGAAYVDHAGKLSEIEIKVKYLKPIFQS